jgi:hypothetical protein
MTNRYDPKHESSGKTGRSETKETVVQMQDKAREVTNEAREQVSQVGRQATEEVKSTLATQKENAANELHGVAQALRQTSMQLRDNEQGMVADYSNRMAEQVDRLSNYLVERDIDDLRRDAEDFARRRPEIFIGGAFTLGLLAARFLKSSASDTYYESGDTRFRRGYSETRDSSTPTTTPFTGGEAYPYADPIETTLPRGGRTESDW